MPKNKKSSLEKNKHSSSKYSLAGLLLDAASFGVGFYHGYCDAQGIPFQKESLEFSLTYGPAIARGGLGATFGGYAGYHNALSCYGEDYRKRRSLSNKIVNGTLGAVVDGTSTGVLCGSLSGVETLIGYGCGYLAGWIFKTS